MKRVLAAAFALAAASGATAQSGYPNRPITMVVGFAPGGGTDTVARIIAKPLGDALGQQIVVENRAGAGGNIASEFTAKAAPDGYTIHLGNVGSLAVAPHIVANLPYDPLRDLAPITMAVVFPNVLVVQPSLKVKTLADFVKLAKDKPGTVTYGSSGIGGAGHLAGELLKTVAKINIVHVPYKGGGPAMQGMLGGQVASIFATPVSSLGQIKSGKVVAIATTGPKRDPLLPDVQTVAEVYPGYEAMNWYAYVAPARTPKPVIDRLHDEIVKALARPDVHAQLNTQGLEPKPSTPEELARYIKSEYEVWGKVVEQAGIKAQ